jgi:hypothetical protein
LDTAAQLNGDVLDAPLPMQDGGFDLAALNTIAARFNPDALEVVEDD